MNDNINQNNECGNPRDYDFNASACDDAAAKQTDMSGSSGKFSHTGSGSADVCPDKIKTSGVGTGIDQPPAPNYCDDAEYVWVARPNDCRPADMVDNADVKGAAEENDRNSARAAEYSDAAGVADNSDAEMARGSAKEKNARDGVGVPYYTDCANAADNADGASVADNPDAKEAECSAAEERNSVDRGLDCDGERKALAGLRDKLFDELGLMFAARSDNARKLVMPIAELEEISDTDALSERFMSRLHSARCVELMETLTKAFFDEAVAIMIIDEASSEPPADSAKQ